LFLERLETRVVPGFVSPLSSLTLGEPDSVAVGDFNVDGKLDLAVANYATSSVSVLLGNGDGTFRPNGSYTAGNSPYVAVGDFNGDGFPDLAVRSSEASYVSVLLGNGDGTFQAARNFAVGTRAAAAPFAGIPPVHSEGWSGRRWHARIHDLDPLEEALLA
jgi:hypothetical protein